MGSGALDLELERLEREANHTHQSSSEIKNTLHFNSWRHALAHGYIFSLHMVNWYRCFVKTI